MATIIKKNINGKAYYYARECQRVNGKPKIVWQKYLGRADDIVRAMSRESTADVPAPKEVIITEFGAVVSLFDLVKRLRLLEHIDRHAPKPGNGPSVGTYLLVAILNRCLAPCSKAGLADWFQTTSLRRLMGISAKQLSSQRFWDNMNHVSSQTIEAIEQDVTTHMVKEFKINLRQVLFDATNSLPTSIPSMNDAPLPKGARASKSARVCALLAWHCSFPPISMYRSSIVPIQAIKPMLPLSPVSLPNWLPGAVNSPRKPSTSPSSSIKATIPLTIWMRLKRVPIISSAPLFQPNIRTFSKHPQSNSTPLQQMVCKACVPSVLQRRSSVCSARYSSPTMKTSSSHGLARFCAKSPNDY
ncbi:hypothetical protein [Desulforhabdus sp. TSK]|uniref:hypothetical protein n=1 Tax=Desulforhabdus sp. TSK TaxID=2925014 RepID=UPI001FC88A91|nr:hypothetical protein [Desulforhabdus sp. TSK]